MNKHNSLILVDGSGYIFRAYYALPPMQKKDGTPVNAVFGFTNMLVKLIEDYSNDKMIVIFDAARENFRNKIFPEYNFIPINHTCDDTITDKGTFLPFSYLNYLHCGKSIFIPKIGNVSENVLNTMNGIFKENQIAFIDISHVLKEYGGLHCCTFNFKYNEN